MKKGWQEYTLDEVYSFASGLSKGKEFFGKGEGFVSFKDIYSNFFLPEELESKVQSTPQEQNSCSVYEGDVFLTRTSEVEDELGMSSVALKTYPKATFNGFTKRLRPDKGIQVDSYFAGYYFRSPLFRAKVSGMSSLTTRASLNNAMLSKLTIILPSYNVQKKTGEILYQYDNLIEINNKRIELLEQSARELYKEWFVRMRFPNYQNTKFSKGIPEGWEVKKIGDTFEILGGGTPSTDNFTYWDGQINWYSPTDLTATNDIFLAKSSKMITELGLQKSSAKLFKPYCVMMTSRATLGVLAINTESSCTNQGFITCIPNDRVPLFYLYYFLFHNKESIEMMATGSTFLEITKGTFKKINILIPDKNLTDLFSDVVSPIFDQIENLQKQNQQLTEMRNRLLPRLISGKLEVKA